MLADLAHAVHPEWAEPVRRTFDGARRLRVGFVGSIFRECTAGRYFERWITGLDSGRFEFPNPVRVRQQAAGRSGE